MVTSLCDLDVGIPEVEANFLLSGRVEAKFLLSSREKNLCCRERSQLHSIFFHTEKNVYSENKEVPATLKRLCFSQRTPPESKLLIMISLSAYWQSGIRGVFLMIVVILQSRLVVGQRVDQLK